MKIFFYSLKHTYKKKRLYESIIDYMNISYSYQQEHLLFDSKTMCLMKNLDQKHLTIQSFVALPYDVWLATMKLDNNKPVIPTIYTQIRAEIINRWKLVLSLH